MKKHRSKAQQAAIRLDPQARLCPVFDATGIRQFPAPQPQEMGFRVLDDCAEEHIQ